MSAASVANIFPPGLSLAGGIPIKSQDLAASIIFAVAYALLIPAVVWRMVSANSRCLPLIRPSIFVVIRVATFAIRAVMADGTYSTGLFIAEQILLLCGFILLCEPLLALLEFHLIRNKPPSPNSQRGLDRIVKLMQTALVVALILGIYAGSQFSNAANNTSTLNTVKTCRDVNAIICAVITALSILVGIVAFLKGGLPKLQSLFLIIIGAILTVPSVYKIVIYEGSSPNPLHTGTKVAFYLFNSLPELLVSVMYFAINVNTGFDIPEAKEKKRISKLMKDGKWAPETNTPYAQQGFKYETQTSQEYPPMARGANAV